jgi:hypothetical protein
MHIGSLENMLKRKEEELERHRQTNSKLMSNTKSFSGGLFTSGDNVFKSQQNVGYGGNNNYMDHNVPENRKFNSSDEFQKNEDNENHLKKLMTSYTSERSGDSNIKQPGKIYSVRKAKVNNP